MRLGIKRCDRLFAAAVMLSATTPLATPLLQAHAAPQVQRSSQAALTIPLTGTLAQAPVPQPLFHLVLQRNGSGWATETNGSTIARISAATTLTPSVREYQVPTASSLTGEIAAGAQGSAWFTESATGKIGHITSEGSIVEYPVSVTATMPTTVPLLWGIVPAKATIWFTEPRDNVIGRFSSRGIAYFPVPTAGAAPFEMALAPDGSLWFTETLANKIGHLVPGPLGQPAITEYTIPTADSGPWAICVAPDGAIYFTESLASKIGRLDPTTGSFTEYPTPTANSDPWSISAGPDGIIWFAEGLGNAVGVFDPLAGGAPSIIEFPLPASSDRPGGIVAFRGVAVFAEFNTPQIGVIRLITS